MFLLTSVVNYFVFCKNSIRSKILHYQKYKSLTEPNNNIGQPWWEHGLANLVLGSISMSNNNVSLIPNFQIKSQISNMISSVNNLSWALLLHTCIFQVTGNRIVSLCFVLMYQKEKGFRLCAPMTELEINSTHGLLPSGEESIKKKN